MCATGNTIGYTSLPSGRIAATNALPPAIALRSECQTPFGSAVEPDV